MKQTTAPITTPSPNRSSLSQATGKPSPGSLFATQTLDMSWRLVLVVLVPIALGSLLDNHYQTKPWLVLTGLVLAVIGGALVIRSAVKKADAAIAANQGDKHV